MRAILPAALAAALLAGAAAPAAAAGYRAEIARTAHGIAHIRAADWGGLGFGEAYAYLEDNLCLIADKVVTVSGERSRWFGAEGTTNVAFNDVPNLESDVFFRAAFDMPELRKRFARTSPAFREMTAGYVAGWNRFLAEHPAASRPEACRGAEWVRPITVDDMLRLNEEKMIQASGGAWLRQTTGAAPPSAPAAVASLGFPAELDSFGLGSNGWAFGRELTANRSGLLLGNPHFPWEGTNRFWEVHLTLPGKYDAMGVAIGGSPGVSIGFNKDVAWTHTVSTDRHFTLFELQLDPKDPTAYLVEGRSIPMTRASVSVPVKGEAAPRTRTLYATIYGPMVTAPQQGLTWSRARAYAMKDANRNNLRGADTWLDIARARSVGEIRATIERTQGIPWVNTIAADRAGDALYADVTATPNVDDAKLKACAPPSGLGPIAAALRVYILDGARAACDWAPAGAPDTAGLLPGASMPALVRADYVANSNDSYWLANASAPMTGQPAIVGPTGNAQNLRTRSGIATIEERAKAGGIDGEAVKAMLYANRNHAAELVGDDLLALCREPGAAPVVDGKPVDLAPACVVLARWDRRMDLASVGAHVFLEFWRDAEKLTTAWATPFDASAPATTPRGLKRDPATAAAIRLALAKAVARLQAAGVPLDRPWGEVQLATRGGFNIPVHGGDSADGVLNAQQAKLVNGVGEVPVHGSSYIQIVTFDAKGPVADAILTYSQSTDPASPVFADQTRLHARKGWVRLPFSAAAIAADPAVTRKVVSGR